jgi:hypothetical protein
MALNDVQNYIINTVKTLSTRSAAELSGPCGSERPWFSPYAGGNQYSEEIH